MFVTVDQVKTIVKNFLNKTGRGGFITGKIEKLEPLKIQINSRLAITESNLYVAPSCTGVYINNTLIHEPLSVGDAVLLITRPSTLEGTKYIMLGKIKPYTNKIEVFL